jgi:hypothetical protein
VDAFVAFEEVGDPNLPEWRVVTVHAEDSGGHFSYAVMGWRLRA